jgi:hypothetical protein
VSTTRSAGFGCAWTMIAQQLGALSISTSDKIIIFIVLIV